jgi:hypothetical protein
MLMASKKSDQALVSLLHQLSGDDAPPLVEDSPSRSLLEETKYRASALHACASIVTGFARFALDELIARYAKKQQVISVDALRKEYEKLDEIAEKWREFCGGPFQEAWLAGLQQAGIGAETPSYHSNDEIDTWAQSRFSTLDRDYFYRVYNELALGGICDIQLDPAKVIQGALAQADEREGYVAVSAVLWQEKFKSYKIFKNYLDKSPIRQQNRGQRLFVHAQDWLEHWHDKSTSRFEMMDEIPADSGDGLLAAERERLEELKKTPRKKRRPS